MVTSRLRVDVNNHAAPDIIARIGEGDTRQIVFLPGYYDEEGEFRQLTIDAENIFARFRMVKPDNTFVIVDMSLLTPTSDPVEFIVTLTPEMSQIAGLCFYDLRIGDGETVDTFLYSAGGRFIVDDDMLTDEMIESVAAVNGLVFPDDFLTSADMEDYATKEYVNDAIAEIPDPLDVYSESEHVVGKWIDNKPVYERTILVSSTLVKSAWTSFADATTWNMDKIISFVGSYQRAWSGGGAITPIPYYEANNVYAGTRFHEASKNFQYRISDETSNTVSNLLFTVRYTKTTD